MQSCNNFLYRDRSIPSIICVTKGTVPGTNNTRGSTVSKYFIFKSRRHFRVVIFEKVVQDQAEAQGSVNANRVPLESAL